MEHQKATERLDGESPHASEDVPALLVILQGCGKSRWANEHPLHPLFIQHIIDLWDASAQGVVLDGPTISSLSF